ncbi:GntR family transcriptional regulator [Allokutzneria oryzae]|uniref:GntR family transcriptional regulator n=1 Tax=Allokutzneria oryzae TaxID=1378989 RepID=A0ABV5ZWH1_9PSEU
MIGGERAILRKIAAQLIRLIEVGDLALGAPMPSESELAARFEVAHDRLFVVKPGRGCFGC